MTTSIETCTPPQISSSKSSFIEKVFIALFKSIKLMRTSLWVWLTQHKPFWGRRGQQQRWRQGGGSVTYRQQSHGPSDGLPEEEMINKSERERERERERQSQWGRETDTHQFYLCKLIFTWSDWLGSYSLIFHKASLSHSHAHNTANRLHTSHTTHSNLLPLVLWL